LPISRRKRTAKMCQKSNDLVREAVGCMGMFGGVAVVGPSKVAAFSA